MQSTAAITILETYRMKLREIQRISRLIKNKQKNYRSVIMLRFDNVIETRSGGNSNQSEPVPTLVIFLTLC